MRYATLGYDYKGRNCGVLDLQEGSIVRVGLDDVYTFGDSPSSGLSYLVGVLSDEGKLTIGDSIEILYLKSKSAIVMNLHGKFLCVRRIALPHSKNGLSCNGDVLMLGGDIPVIVPPSGAAMFEYGEGILRLVVYGVIVVTLVGAPLNIEFENARRSDIDYLPTVDALPELTETLHSRVSRLMLAGKF